MDTVTLLKGLALVAFAICLITYSVMTTGGIFSNHESCKPKDDDNE